MTKRRKTSVIALTKEDRQEKVAKIIRKNPYSSVREIAGILKVGKSTIHKDIKEIKANIARTTAEEFRFHQNRVLREIHDMKQHCLRQLKKLAKQPTKGARWVEEFTKLIEKEAKILGLYAPEMRVLAVANMSKGIVGATERDHAINAIMFGIESGVIDIDPADIKQIENTKAASGQTLQ